MFKDILVIVITAFALLGVYCFVTTVLQIFSLPQFPTSVVIMNNTQDDKTFKKVKYIEENLPNNYTVLYPFDSDKNEAEQQRIMFEYLKDVLDVNNR